MMIRLTGMAARIGGAVALSALLAACTGSSFLGGGGDGGAAADAALADTSPSQAALAEVEPTALPAIATECPEIRVRPGAGTIATYAGGRSGDPRALNYQVVIDQQSRNCVVSNGLITVRMGASGRVMLGPSASTSSVTVPLRFAVERDDVAIYSQLYRIPVQIAPPARSEEFVQVVENVAIPYLGGERIIIWVGFDSGS